MPKGLRLALLAVALSASTAMADTDPAKPMHFDDVPAMIDDFGDYAADNNTFQLISSKPLKIRLSPSVISGEPAENAESEVRRAGLYGVYRTLIHTDAQVVTVQVVPREVTLNPQSARLLSSPALQISATRAQALAAASKLIKVKDLQDLVVPEPAGTIQLDNWRADFESLYFKEAGQQALLDALQGSGASVTYKE
ncbi:hypothetical protein [Pseudomonas nitroreducens]|uniref:hypothetical protein n=1 Tax=Pseudomonas nitroreducens TaxID=46680 RepID=UPI00265AEBB5|nr:hypothetical protein [Pseudomonas nitroreducens]MCP1651816.1 hypothetical protein [Pseudomonas nitroreducens]MCP1689556.1 hypothetical protein [Pseudomonas nitroreducens]